MGLANDQQGSFGTQDIERACDWAVGPPVPDVFRHGDYVRTRWLRLLNALLEKDRETIGFVSVATVTCEGPDGQSDAPAVAQHIDRRILADLELTHRDGDLVEAVDGAVAHLRTAASVRSARSTLPTSE